MGDGRQVVFSRQTRGESGLLFQLDIHFHQIKMLIKDYVDFVLAMSVL